MSLTPSGTRVWLALSRTARRLGDVARRDLEAQNLCPTDFAVLEILLHKGPLPVNTIGRRVLLTSGSITTAVDRLASRGLVQRRAHPTDRRARLVALTSTGRALIGQAFAAHSATLESAVSSLSEEERRTLVRLLLKLEHGAARSETVGAVRSDPLTITLSEKGGTS
jgi:MarR family 2-MHQ and catechol resistance regulon transcriptional repressor